MIVAIVSAVLSFIPAIIVGKNLAVGWGILCYFISIIAGVAGFYIGKFLNEFVGDRFIITNGGFLSLVTEKFDALYGPQITGLFIGLFVPVIILFGIHDSKGKKISEKAMSDRAGISKIAKQYVMPLINEDEEQFSGFGKIVNRVEKTENKVIYVNWELENGNYISTISNDIVSDLIPKTNDIVKILDVDTKSFIPMEEYRRFKYENFDEEVNEYLEKEVYEDIIRYIKYGNRRSSIYSDFEPYNAEIANWCKYFGYKQQAVKKGTEWVLYEKADYTHWYFDNGKTGTEEDYNAFKNKYFLSSWDKMRIVDAEIDKFRKEHHGLYPGADSKITLDDIKGFDNEIKELNDSGKYWFREKYGTTPFVLNVVKEYDADFLSFVTEKWNEYPDTMKLHLEYEKNNSGSFSDYLSNKLQNYNLYENPYRNDADYLLINCKELKESAIKGQLREGEFSFIESAEDFRKLHKLSDYSTPQREKLLEAYYSSDEYKDRLKLFKQLVRFDNAKIIANAEYTLNGASDKVVAGRQYIRYPVVLQIEIASAEGWQKKDIPIEVKDGNIVFRQDY